MYLNVEARKVFILQNAESQQSGSRCMLQKSRLKKSSPEQWLHRNSHWKCFTKKAVLKHFTTFTGKRQC